jgi:hypothetical protein
MHKLTSTRLLAPCNGEDPLLEAATMERKILLSERARTGFE